MGAANLLSFLGRSDEEREAFKVLIAHEDEVFEMQPCEDSSLAAHVRADVPRFQLLNARGKLTRATMTRKSDRNLFATIVIGVVLFIKTGLSWGDVIHFFASL